MKKQKGITLIALIITIIVLLILAGVSISLLVGDNGALKKAVNAKTATERTSVIEYAQAEIIGKQAENEGSNIKKSDLISILNNYFSNVSEIQDSENILEETVTSKSNYGVYDIKVSEIYNGGFLEDKFSYIVEEASGETYTLSKNIPTSSVDGGSRNLESISCKVGEKIEVTLPPIISLIDDKYTVLSDYRIAESGAVRLSNDTAISNGRFYIVPDGSSITPTSRADVTSRYDVSGSSSSSTSGFVSGSASTTVTVTGGNNNGGDEPDVSGSGSSSTGGTISGNGTTEGTVTGSKVKFECIANQVGVVNIEIDYYIYDEQESSRHTVSFTVNIEE